MISERTKERLLTVLAWDRNIQRFALPGIVGLSLIGLGIWKKIAWLTVTGLILAAPILFCYLLIMLVFPIMLIFEKPPKRHWED